MANTTFSGPVISDNGFITTSYTLVQAAAIDRSSDWFSISVHF